jgi:hypothetical protein
MADVLRERELVEEHRNELGGRPVRVQALDGDGDRRTDGVPDVDRGHAALRELAAERVIPDRVRCVGHGSYRMITRSVANLKDIE